MTAKYYIDGKKITKKALIAKLGEDRVKRMTTESRDAFMADPLEEQSYYIGEGFLEIRFA